MIQFLKNRNHKVPQKNNGGKEEMPQKIPNEKKPLWPLFEQEKGKSYGKGQMVYLQGELADSFFYLKKGRVKIFLTSENGMEKTLSLLEQAIFLGKLLFLTVCPGFLRQKPSARVRSSG